MSASPPLINLYHSTATSTLINLKINNSPPCCVFSRLQHIVCAVINFNDRRAQVTSNSSYKFANVIWRLRSLLLLLHEITLERSMINRHKFSKHSNMLLKLPGKQLRCARCNSQAFAMYSRPWGLVSAIRLFFVVVCSFSFVVLLFCTPNLIENCYSILRYLSSIFPHFTENNISSMSAWNDEATTSPSGEL